MRPAPLAEVAEPQGRAVTVGYVAAQVPSLAGPLLAGAASEAVDSSSLRFLAAAALQKLKEEEKEKVKEKLKAESVVQQQAAVALERARLLLEKRSANPSSSSSSLRRKRKKRRRTKVPKTSSSRLRLPARAALRSRHLRGDPGCVVSVCLSVQRFSGEDQLAPASCTSSRLRMDDYDELTPEWSTFVQGFVFRRISLFYLSVFIMDACDELIPVKATWIQRFLPLNISPDSLRQYGLARDQGTPCEDRRLQWFYEQCHS